jgi:hypothetical protein
MSDGKRRGKLEHALSEILGRPTQVEFVGPGGGSSEPPARRITAEGARQEKLRRLVAEEPLLEAAVREWDLELLD